MIQQPNKKLLLTLSFLLSLFFGVAQTDANSKEIVTVKFSNYSVETDKLIQSEFSKKDGLKSIYACIPAGIVVIESGRPISDKEKELINSKIKSVNKSLNFEMLEGLTLMQAEEKCSVKRNLEK